jgi:hypothetical protein
LVGGKVGPTDMDVLYGYDIKNKLNKKKCELMPQSLVKDTYIIVVFYAKFTIFVSLSSAPGALVSMTH